jgi:PAS domain S-box-containing protein
MHNGSSGSHLVPLGLRELLDASPDIIFACDADGALLWLNRAFGLLMDRPADEQLGKHWSTAVAPHEHRRLARLFLRQRRRRTEVVETALPLLASQGRDVWVTVRVVLLERADGGMIYVGTARALAVGGERGARAAGAPPTAGHEPATAEAESGTAPASGSSSSAGPLAGSAPGSLQADRRPRGGLAAALSLFTRGRNGGSAPAPPAATPAPAAGAPVSSPAAESTTDGAPLRRLVEQLRFELDEARALAQGKGEFLATMTHEIRTPMNGMMGMAHLLLETDLDGEQRSMVEVLLQSGQALLDLINDTLDFSRVEAGRLELERIPFDLRVATNEVAALLAPLANEKGLHFDCRVHHEVPSLVLGDPGRLRQVLLNLGGNGVKFTEQGNVVLSVGRVREDERSVTLRWAVTDTGPGMSEEQKGRIFQAFGQGDNSIARRYGGTGLGLAISSRLVSLMGGTIGLESSPGEGSRFWFDVTLEKQAETAETPSTSPSKAELAGLRVLVVDPSAAMRRSFAAKLEAWGCRVEVAEDAGRALDQLHEAAQAGDAFRFALIERELPGMNGEELGAAIRADGVHDGTLTALVTAVGRRGDAARARARGFSAYLMKPLDWDELATALAEVLHVTATTPAGAPPPLVTRHSLAEARRSRLRILLVEDSPVSQLVTEWTLRRLGYGLRTVATVREGLETCAQEPFDLVLLDLQLPDGDGFELARVLRSREAPGRRVPIVAMTGCVEPGDREKCLAAGMDDYLPKPVDLGLLSRVVEELTEGASGADAADEERPAEAAEGAWTVKPGRGCASDPAKIAVVVDDTPLLRAVEAAEADADGARGWADGRAASGDTALEAGLGERPAGFESTNAAAILASEPRAAGPEPAGCADAEAGAAEPAPVLHALSNQDVLPLYEGMGPEPLDAGESRPAIDRDRLEQTCMGIGSLRETVINAFLTEVRPRLEKLSCALNACDGRQVEFEAHGLKGMCATLGAAVCAEAFAGLERLGRERTLEGAPRLLKQAYLEVTRTEQFLSRMERERKAA